jgi:hypothetical protein
VELHDPPADGQQTIDLFLNGPLVLPERAWACARSFSGRHYGVSPAGFSRTRSRCFFAVSQSGRRSGIQRFGTYSLAAASARPQQSPCISRSCVGGLSRPFCKVVCGFALERTARTVPARHTAPLRRQPLCVERPRDGQQIRARAEIVPSARPHGDDGGASRQPPAAPAPPKARTGRYLLWHELLQRVFETDVLSCPKCGGRPRLLCIVHDGFSARRYLQGVSAQSPPAEARPPPTAGTTSA